MNEYTDTYSAQTIFYFSGTGNSRRISIWLAQQANGKGLSTTIYNIENQKSYPSIQENSLIGFVFPVHGFITIWAMLKFIIFFPPNKSSSRVYTVTSLGACKLGNLIIPGWEGSGLYLPLLILILKGYRPAGACHIRATPENWTSLIPGHSKNANAWMLARARNNTLNFADKLFANKWSFYGLLSFLIGIIFLPLSLAYLFWGRFFLAKINFATTKCNGCKICQNNCPVNAIEFYQKRPFWKFNCESCMRCMNFCPQQAIQANLPLVAIITFFLLYPVSHFAEKLFGTKHISASIIIYFVSLLTLALLYWLFFLAIRIKWINIIFEYLAPTKYFFKYKELNTIITDFKNNKSDEKGS